MHRSKLLFAAVVQWLAISGSTDAQEATAGVIVAAEAEPASLTSPSIEQTEEQKNQIPGALPSEPTEMNRGRASNFEDQLQRMPGLSRTMGPK